MAPRKLTRKQYDAAYRVALAKCLVRYNGMVLAPSFATKAIRPHLAAFIEQFAQNIHDMPLPKLNRWLGYIQGQLIATGATDVTTERDFTRPLFRPLDYPDEQ